MIVCNPPTTFLTHVFANAFLVFLLAGVLARELEQLNHHDDALTPERRTEMEDIAKLVVSLVDHDASIKESPVLATYGSSAYVVRLLCRIVCNAFTITDPESRPIGTGLFLGKVTSE